MSKVAPPLMIYGHSEIRDRYARQGFGFAQITRDQVEIMNRQICRVAYMRCMRARRDTSS